MFASLVPKIQNEKLKMSTLKAYKILIYRYYFSEILYNYFSEKVDGGGEGRDGDRA